MTKSAVEQARAVYRVSGYFFMAWLITWFACIWIGPVRIELFVTGLFSFILSLIFHEVAKNVEKELQ